jgi:hypothetical protein
MSSVQPVLSNGLVKWSLFKGGMSRDVQYFLFRSFACVSLTVTILFNFSLAATQSHTLPVFSDAAARGTSVHVPVHGLQPGLHGAGGGG